MKISKSLVFFSAFLLISVFSFFAFYSVPEKAQDVKEENLGKMTDICIFPRVVHICPDGCAFTIPSSTIGQGWTFSGFGSGKPGPGCNAVPSSETAGPGETVTLTGTGGAFGQRCTHGYYMSNSEGSTFCKVSIIADLDCTPLCDPQ